MKVHTKGGNIMATTTTKEKAKKDSSTSRFFMKVPNDDEGWQTIKAIRKSLNRDRYAIVLKGNGPRQGPGYHHCKREDWQEIRVYLNVKDDIRRRETISSKMGEMNRKFREEELRHEIEMEDIYKTYKWWIR
tara:strand:- start:183 stop:578 length:396 start_codon:yes stop_codon:yes gene_type:complete